MMNEAGGLTLKPFCPVMQHNVIPYQSFAGANGCSSPHTGVFHGAKEVAGVAPGGTMLAPVGAAAAPPLQDVAI